MRIAARIGLLRTMVFTHLPSNVLLASVAFAPNLTAAIALLLARSLLSQMDVPTRQAYIAAMVDPDERTAAAATTNTARYIARPFGPLVGTALMHSVALGAPWVVAGPRWRTIVASSNAASSAESPNASANRVTVSRCGT